MPLDDEVEDLARENDKIFFGLRVGVQDRSDINLCACVIQEGEFTRNLWNQLTLIPTRADKRKCGVLEESVPNKSAAFFISLSSSLCLSLRAFALGSKTASSSYSSSSSSSSSSSAGLEARAASFSASFAFRVPFFFGGAALDPGTGGFSCSDSEFSQSL